MAALMVNLLPVVAKTGPLFFFLHLSHEMDLVDPWDSNQFSLLLLLSSLHCFNLIHQSELQGELLIIFANHLYLFLFSSSILRMTVSCSYEEQQLRYHISITWRMLKKKKRPYLSVTDRCTGHCELGLAALYRTTLHCTLLRVFSRTLLFWGLLSFPP